MMETYDKIIKNADSRKIITATDLANDNSNTYYNY